MKTLSNKEYFKENEKEVFRSIREQIEPDAKIVTELYQKINNGFTPKQKPKIFKFAPILASVCVIAVATVWVTPYLTNGNAINDAVPPGTLSSDSNIGVDETDVLRVVDEETDLGYSIENSVLHSIDGYTLTGKTPLDEKYVGEYLGQHSLMGGTSTFTSIGYTSSDRYIDKYKNTEPNYEYEYKYEYYLDVYSLTEYPSDFAVAVEIEEGKFYTYIKDDYKAETLNDFVRDFKLESNLNYADLIFSPRSDYIENIPINFNVTFPKEVMLGLLFSENVYENTIIDDYTDETDTSISPGIKLNIEGFGELTTPIWGYHYYFETVKNATKQFEIGREKYERLYKAYEIASYHETIKKTNNNSYSGFFYDKGYYSNIHHKVANNNIGELLDTVVYAIYDNKVSVLRDIYSINGVSPKDAVAIKFSDDKTYYLYLQTNYEKNTLGGLIENDSVFNFINDIIFKDSEPCLPGDTDNIWKRMFADESLESCGLEFYNNDILIQCSAGLEGNELIKITLALNSQGYLQIDFFGQKSTFYVGMDFVEEARIISEMKKADIENLNTIE